MIRGTLSETASQAFLGMSVACAKCHNHPMEKWTNDQYYQMANLFARVRVKSGSRDGENIVFTATRAIWSSPCAANRSRPRRWTARRCGWIPRRPPRRIWPTGWSRGTTRISAAPLSIGFGPIIFGVGLVESVDDLRATNPASNEKLLSAAARYPGRPPISI